MSIPIRCFTCGKAIAHLYPRYQQMIANGKTPIEVLDILGLKRYCCKRMLSTHVDIDEIEGEYPVYPGRIQRLNKAKIAGGEEPLDSDSSEDKSSSSEVVSESSEESSSEE